jgi:FkbM family methyltransferase
MGVAQRGGGRVISAGALRHLVRLPRLIGQARNWPLVLKDALGRQQSDYILHLRNGTRCAMEPGGSDWWIFLEIFVIGQYDLALDRLRRARTIVDIGANVGFFTLFAASQNRSARIEAFEPVAANFARLKENIALNEGARIRANLQAAAAEPGKVRIYLTPTDNASGHSMYQVTDRFEEVEAVTLENVIGRFGADGCDLLKLDCEGAEYDIFKRLPADAFRKIGAVVMEYHDEGQGREIEDILKANGFSTRKHPAYWILYGERPGTR